MPESTTGVSWVLLQKCCVRPPPLVHTWLRTAGAALVVGKKPNLKRLTLWVERGLFCQPLCLWVSRVSWVAHPLLRCCRLGHFAVASIVCDTENATRRQEINRTTEIQNVLLPQRHTCLTFLPMHFATDSQSLVPNIDTTRRS